jgi:hypothetical protein
MSFDLVPLAAALERCKPFWENVAPQPRVLISFSPPGPSLDCLFEGMAPGEVAWIAGWPVQGKTSLGLDLAVRASRCGPVTFLSRCATPQNLAARVVSQVSGIGCAKVSLGFLTAKESAHVSEVAADLAACRLTFGSWEDGGDDARVDLPGMEALRGPEPPVLAFVDDLGLSSATFPWDARRLRRHLDAWRKAAQDARVPLVLLVGLPWPPGGDDGQPDLIDLAEAGLPLNQARTVLLLKRFANRGPPEPRGFYQDELKITVARWPGRLGGSIVLCVFQRDNGQIVPRPGFRP